MLYYVRTGDLDCTAQATSHRHAAIKALKNCDKDLGVCLVVSEREINEDDISGNVYFLTQSILDDCELRLVG
jgi:hypothetical protein